MENFYYANSISCGPGLSKGIPVWETLPIVEMVEPGKLGVLVPEEGGNSRTLAPDAGEDSEREEPFKGLGLWMRSRKAYAAPCSKRVQSPRLRRIGIGR